MAVLDYLANFLSYQSVFVRVYCKNSIINFELKINFLITCTIFGSVFVIEIKLGGI